MADLADLIALKVTTVHKLENEIQKMEAELLRKKMMLKHHEESLENFKKAAEAEADAKALADADPEDLVVEIQAKLAAEALAQANIAAEAEARVKAEAEAEARVKAEAEAQTLAKIAAEAEARVKAETEAQVVYDLYKIQTEQTEQETAAAAVAAVGSWVTQTARKTNMSYTSAAKSAPDATPVAASNTKPKGAKSYSQDPIVMFNGPNPTKDTGGFALNVSKALENRNIWNTPNNGTWGIFPTSCDKNEGSIYVLAVFDNGEWKTDLSDVPNDYKVVWKGVYKRTDDITDKAGINTDKVRDCLPKTMEEYEKLCFGIHTLITVIVGNNPKGSRRFKYDVRLYPWYRYRNKDSCYSRHASIGDYFNQAGDKDLGNGARRSAAGGASENKYAALKDAWNDE
jgi:hypothetical protein